MCFWFKESVEQQDFDALFSLMMRTGGVCSVPGRQCLEEKHLPDFQSPYPLM